MCLALFLNTSSLCQHLIPSLNHLHVFSQLFLITIFNTGEQWLLCAFSRFMVRIIGMGLLVVFATWSKKVASGHCGGEME